MSSVTFSINTPMSKNNKLQLELSKMIDVNTPIIAIQDHDFARIDELVLKVAGSKAVVEEWSPGFKGGKLGVCVKLQNGEEVLAKPKSNVVGSQMELHKFLFHHYDWETPALYPQGTYPQPDTFLVLKDVPEDMLKSPDIASLMHLMAQRRLYGPDFNTTIILVSSSIVVPDILSEYVSYLEIGVVDSEEDIHALIDEHTATNHYRTLEDEEWRALMPSLKGMTLFQIDRMLDMAMSSNGTLSSEDKAMILRQKKQMVRKSGLLDLIDTPDITLIEGQDKDKQLLNHLNNSIGGLDELKKYLVRKKKVFGNPAKAARCHLSVPKGVFIVGMPGCGKSLCAKVTATLFEAPLLKLDMGSMMGKYVGQSEENLRKAIRIAEAAAPCVLWIDEIEKAFAGVGGSNSEILTRMFGYFLSWMQEKQSSVYVIATANNAEGLPPELKRKGRFDEIFCVNLPNEKERLAIFNVHLRNKKQQELKFLSPELKKATEGFNGADIESVVNETLERLFVQKLDTADTKDFLIKISEPDLVATAKETVSISSSCSSQIEKMKEVFKESSFKDATTGEMTKKK